MLYGDRAMRLVLCYLDLCLSVLEGKSPSWVSEIDTRFDIQSTDIQQVGILGFASFSLPIAMAQNFYTILICRFLSGTFGAASSKLNMAEHYPLSPRGLKLTSEKRSGCHWWCNW